MPLHALVDVIRTHAVANPDARAVTYAGVSQTFADLDRRSSQVANALIGAGVGPRTGWPTSTRTSPPTSRWPSEP